MQGCSCTTGAERRCVFEADAEEIFLELLFHPGDGAVEDFAAFVDQDDLVADLLDLFHTMGTEYDRAAVAGQLVDFVLDEIGVDGIETAEGFVEDDESGLVQDGGDELQFLTHAFAQVFDFLVPPGLHLESFEPVADLVGRFGFGEPLQLREVDGLGADLHLFIQTTLLGHVADLFTVFFGIEGAAVEEDPALVGIEDTGDHAYEGRLSGPIGSEQTEDGTFVDVEADGIDCGLGGVCFRDALYVEECHRLIYLVSRVSLENVTNFGQIYRVMRRKFWVIPMILMVMLFGSWGFLVHRTVNQLAIYELPRPMLAFFWKNKDSLVRNAPRPDIRRNTDKQEAPRHFVDLEAYGDSAAWKMPLHLEEAIKRYTLDTLKKYGMVPYVIQDVLVRLTESMRALNRDSIIYYATDLGHYIGDAHVPLHTSLNYDGQLSGQKGIHALWETAVPNMTMDSYQLRDGHKAKFVSDPALAVWESIRHTHSLVQTMFDEEKAAAVGVPDSVKYVMVHKYGKTFRDYSNAYAKIYAVKLGSMVNDQLLASADMIADLWYTAWVNAGKPDLNSLIDGAVDKKAMKTELKAYKKNRLIEKGMLEARKLDGGE